MRILATFWSLSIIVITSGCTGKIITKNLDPKTISNIGQEFEGVIHYPQGMFYEISETTIRKDKEGKVIAWAAEKTTSDTYCEPVKQYKVITKTDFTRPQLTTYEHGILEEYTFGATLSPDGANLIGVNSTSKPDRGQTFGNLTSAAANIAKDVALVEEIAPPCNDGSVVLDYLDYNKFKLDDQGKLIVR